MKMSKLRFMSEFTNLKRIMEAKESFERLHPEVEVVIEQSADHFESLSACRSDEAPDIVESGGWALFNREGMFVDLNPFVEQSGMEADLYTGPLAIARHNGTLPGLPVDMSVPLLVFNKEMFDKAGLPYPEDDWTWERFVEAAKKLTIRGEDGVAVQFGFGIGVDIEWYEPFVFRNGGSYLSPDGRTARGYADSPATIEAMQKIIDAYRVHGIIRKPKEPSSAGQLHEGFAMIFGFMWFAGGLIHHGIDHRRFGLARLPRLAEGRDGNMIYMGGAGITGKCPQPGLAWDFLRHYLIDSPSWPLPLSRSQAEERGLHEHRIWSRYLEELQHAQPSGFYLNEKWNSSRQLINEDIERMIVGGADVAKMLRSWTRYA